MLEVDVFTTTGLICGACFVLLCFIAYWYILPSEDGLSYRQKRLLTFYDLCVACLFFTQAVLVVEVLGATDSAIGMESENTARGKVLLHVHMFSHVSYLLDTVVICYSGQPHRLGIGRFYYGSVIFVLWGLIIDNVLEMGTTRFMVLLDSLMLSAVYLYMALAPWTGHGKGMLRCVCILAQLLGHCAFSVYFVALLINVTMGECDSALIKVFGTWLLHSIAMFWRSAHDIWRLRPETAEHKATPGAENVGE
jgi:hypothetical protein